MSRNSLPLDGALNDRPGRPLSVIGQSQSSSKVNKKCRGIKELPSLFFTARVVIGKSVVIVVVSYLKNQQVVIA